MELTEVTLLYSQVSILIEINFGLNYTGCYRVADHLTQVHVTQVTIN